MLRYIETYKLRKKTYGIEDYDQPGDHFMPDREHKRFKVWAGGGGGWEFDSLEESRKFLHDYMKMELSSDIVLFKDNLATATSLLSMLNDDPFNLGWFRINT